MKSALRRSRLVVIVASVLAASCLASAGEAAALDMAVTFDDLPATGPLPPGVTRLAVAAQLIEALRRQAVPGPVAFANALPAVREPELADALQAWSRAGFRLGNHTYSHLDLSRVGAAEFIADIERNESALASLAPPGSAKYFRYPYLHEGNTADKRDTVRRWLHSKGYAISPATVYLDDWVWNEAYARCSARADESAIARMKTLFIETSLARLDWARELSARLFRRQVKHILLLHVGAFDAVVLDELLGAYRAAGVTFVGLDAAVKDEAYAMPLELVGEGDRAFLLQAAQSKGVELPKIPPGAPAEIEGLCR
jgi:peptidoglycan/xylan/chitin deacetylase (PgdA/CDA1 family)